MAFSGHETFPVREGWLHKGLKLLVEQPELLVDEFCHDWLGVGKNMGRSIKHWLFVTGLAHRESTKKAAPMVPTDLGHLVWEQDPYFMELGTLWALHVNLVQPGSTAESWDWFFNHFHLARFEKSVCVESLRRHLDVTVKKAASHSTLERDISCLLSFYSRPIPAEVVDPEEAIECPFRELGLISYFRSSGYYQLNTGSKSVPAEMLCYAISLASHAADVSGEGISITDLARMAGGPARAFQLTPETLFEAVSEAEGVLGADVVEIVGQAGRRTVRIKQRPPLEWLRGYYNRVDVQRSLHAA